MSLRSPRCRSRATSADGRPAPWLGAVLLLLPFLSGCGGERSPAPPPVGAAGMVSSAHELATRAGVAVLEDGGNAFDAAVTVAAVLTVVEPMSSNLLGGYGTVVLWDAEAETARYLDMNGRFPTAVDAEVFRRAADPDRLLHSAAAVSTPGNLDGFETLWREYGTRSWDRLLRPAIEHAEAGFPVDERLAAAITVAWPDFDDYARSIFGREGRPLEPGETLVQRHLATSLRSVAEEGSRVLHGGSLGQTVDAELERRGGFLRLADLEAHRSEWLEPIAIDYRGTRVVTAGPPSNSFAALVCLGIMSRFDNTAAGRDSADYWHRFAEATEQAFWARRRWAGGPEESPPPLDRLLAEPFWEERAAAIDPARARDFRASLLDLDTDATDREGENTTHFVVADRGGNVVSATITLGDGFGSRVVVEGTGVLLNNSLAYSTFEPPGNPMDALPGRRKHSSKSPALLLRDGRPWIALGTPGGHTIPQTLPQMVIALVDFGLSLDDALALPRVAFDEPDHLLVEEGLATELVEELEARGHRIALREQIGLAHALEVVRDAEGRAIDFVGAADPRGGGVAMAALSARR